MRSLVLGFFATVVLPAVVLPAAASAAPLPASKLMGRWCGDPANYSFSRSALVVMRKGEKPVSLRIKEIKSSDTEIQVFFAEPYGGGSRFAGFDGKAMTQLGSTFGTMPARSFRRC